MSDTLPSHAQAVVVGGGVVGCSVAYHLVRLGWTDVVLLERKALTCGTTWHAAGLVTQLRATHNMTRLAQYTNRLYRSLEAETGQATGFRQVGGITVATHHERLEELRRAASMARCFGVDAHMITPAEVAELWPLITTEDLVGAVYLPEDGKCNPTDATQALARGARMEGATILENVRVTGFEIRDRRVARVLTDQGPIACEAVINCAGMWARELGRMAGVNVPLHAAEHFYVVTEPMEGMTPELPILRDVDAHAYYKEDAGKLLLGAFEPEAKPWGMDGIPEDFCFDQLPEDWDHFQPIMELALHRLPALAETGIQLFFNGPESFTPDDRYLLGPAPELDNYFVAAGFNSVGVLSAGGAGKVLAEWVVHGHAPMDLWDVDIRRCMAFQGNSRYLRDRTVEGLGLLLDVHWPFRQLESARPVRTSALHERLRERGACFGEALGWERPNWFAPPGVEPVYRYSYGRQNWFEHCAAEHRAVREAVGLFDQSSFVKYLLQGRDAARVLGRVCANDVAVDPGRVVYTQWLNQRGGIEADLTVTRLDQERFLIVTSPGSQTRDFDWLRRHLPADAHATLTDVTSGLCMLGVMGPRSRELLSRLTDADLSNQAFPFATSREIDLAYARVRATRLTYVGELGWELYVPTEFVLALYDAIVGCGADLGLAHAGFHALNSLRIEKGYRHWGEDIGVDDTPLEAGLGFAVAFGKEGGFIGEEALERQREQGLRRRLVTFAMDSAEPLLYHNEPIWRDGTLVGYITSGMFGHTLGRAIGLGYVAHEEGVGAGFVTSGSYEIEVAGERLPASASLRPLYDPRSERTRA